MKRKTAALFIAGLVVVAIGTGVWLAVQHYSALTVSGPSSSLLAPATVYVTVTENGQSALGLLTINGDCPNNPLSPQGSSFSCQLTAAAGASNYQITGMSFQSFASNQLY